MLFHFNIDTILIPQQRKRKKKLKEHYYLGNGIFFVQFNLQLKIGKVLRVLWSLLLFPFFFFSNWSKGCWGSSFNWYFSDLWFSTGWLYNVYCCNFVSCSFVFLKGLISSLPIYFATFVFLYMNRIGTDNLVGIL